MDLRNHERCRELAGTLRSLERLKIDAQSEIARRTETVGNLQGQVQVERNTLSSIKEALDRMKDEIARAGARFVRKPTVGTAISEAFRRVPYVVEEYNRQQAQLRDVEAQLAAERSLLADAKEKLELVNEKIDENYEYQRRNNC